MKTKLERIAAKARSNKRQRFTSLAHHITPQLLGESLSEIPYNTGAGIDRIDIKKAQEKFSLWSQEVIKQIHQFGYRPPAARRVYIPKPGKVEKRPLNVPTVFDRTLQRSVSKLLTEIYETDFLDCSFGGRPKRNAHQAIATVKKAIMARRVNFVYEADLKNFFGSLNHGWVERFIDLRVGDPRITTLIKRWLKAGHMENGQHEVSTVGAAQGGPISVLLSNIYLHYVLDLWIEKVVKPKLLGEVCYVRYLDDFILCFEKKIDAERFERVLIKRLAKFSLELEPSKTRLIEFGRFANERVKRRNEKVQTFYFLGFTFFNSRAGNGGYALGIKTEKTRLKRSIAKLKQIISAKRHKPLLEQNLSINQFMTGTYCYYGIMGNIESLRQLYYYAIKQWRKSLSSRSQSGKVNWEKYRKILHHYPIRRPRIFVGYKQLYQMALL